MAASIWNPGASSLVPTANGTGTVTERQIATGGQTLVNLSLFTYTLGVNALQVYVNGSLQTLGLGYTETSTSSITLTTPLVIGDEITVTGILDITNVVAVGAEGPVGGVVLGNFTLDQYTTNSRIEFPATNPLSWAAGAGSMYFESDITFNDYFAANPGGHCAFVLRCDTDVISSSVRGVGFICGEVSGAVEGTQTVPGMQVETWANGIAPGTDRFLIPGAESPFGKPLLDNTKYRFQAESVFSKASERYIRIVCSRWVAAKNAYDLEFDTGYYHDDNIWYDTTKFGFVFAQVFASNLVPWSIACTNARVIWGPAPVGLASNIDRVSKYGTPFESDIKFLGNSRAVRLNTVGVDFANWTHFRTATANGSTTVLATPDGTGTAANFLATNSRNASYYQSVSVGMAAGYAVVEGFSVGITHPPIKFNVGPGVTIATVKSTGLNILGGTSDIGVAIGYGVGLTNFGGTTANAYSSASTLNIENICTVGTIAALMSSTPSNAQVETVLRPLYCMFSTLIADLRAKKVI